MKLIFLPKGGQGFSQGSVFPIMEIPVTGEGAESTTLKDFQWWAPTDKWQQWLKKNPRDWKAESSSYTDLTADQVFEFFDSLDSSPIISFDEFHSLVEQFLFEQEEGISNEEASKRVTKFLFAYNKLSQENKISTSLDLDSLEKNRKYAFILDLAGEGGGEVPETRNAYGIKILPTKENAKFYLGEMDETILTGEVETDEPIGVTFIETSKIVGKAALGGVFVLGAVGLGIKASGAIASRIGLTRLLSSVLPSMARTGTSGARNLGILGKSVRNAKYYTKTLGGSIPFIKGTSQALKAGFKAGDALKWGRMSVGSARAASGLARATNPIGWIISGVMATQQAYNWLSNKQAPRLGQIEDAGIDVHDSFSPGSIPNGESITICWTQEAGGGGVLSALGSVFVDSDTRTTMDVVKLGNFNNKAYFYLVDIHSESYSNLLKENSMILLAFEEKAKFDRGVLDNDDLEFEFIPIKDGSSLAATTYFQGYCSWDELDQTYSKSDDKMLDVPENAPDNYSFHFKYGKNDNIINVTGNLVKNLDSVDSVKSTLLSKGEEGGKSNESYATDTSSQVLSFSEFFSFPPVNEEEEFPEEISKVYLTETQRVASYTVEEISYADKSLEDQELPDLLSFIIPNDYLEAEDDSTIKVDSIQKVTIKSPKKGTIIIETEDAPEPVPVAQVGATGEEFSEPEIEGGVPVEVTKDEVKIKFRDNPDALNAIGIPDVTKIKDKDRKDKIKFLDVITPEEKKDLDIEDWDYIKKVKIYKEGKTGDPTMVKFKAGGITGDRTRKIKSSDANFDVALKVADRIQSGFKSVSDKEKGEK
jgi:hypothetical protein